jgi:alpha-1,2-mannosyltransferase
MLSRLRARPTAEHLLIAAVVLVVTAQAAVIANRRLTHLGDFDVSREFGRRLLAGETLYAGGLHYPYMPSAALYFAPLALLPPGVGLVVRYGVALVCLWLTLRLLYTMMSACDASLVARRVSLAGLTLLLASHYILRDLDDGGPHLILLAMVIGGVYCIWRRRAVAGAVWLGLAAALQAPNALFLPYLVWKRQWRLTALTAAALAVWTVLPVVWMGPASWWQHQDEWLRAAFASASGTPSGGAKESEDRLQNQALRPVLSRCCAADMGTLLPALGAIALIALAAWWSRRAQTRDDDQAWLVESSAVLILSVLLSPVAWVQHLVVVIPALYLIVAARRGSRGLSVPARAAMLLYFLLAVLFNREVLGRDTYLVLLDHGLHTVCMLLVLAVLLRLEGAAPPASGAGGGLEASTAAHQAASARCARLTGTGAGHTAGMGAGPTTGMGAGGTDGAGDT